MLAGLALTGCETTQEKSARLERVALARAKAAPLGTTGLKIAAPSKTIKIASSSVVHSSEGTAAVVTLRNDGVSGQREVPLAITVHGAGGTAVYSNSSPGLSTSLVAAAYVPARGEATWVDDQVQASSTPVSVTGEAGEGKSTSGRPPQIVIGADSLGEEPGGAAVVSGTVANRSSVPQKELVVAAVVSSDGHVTGAGRAVLARLAPGAASGFQIFLVGSAPKGARLAVSAPPTTFG